MAFALCHVADRGSGRVRVDVVDVRRAEPGELVIARLIACPA